MKDARRSGPGIAGGFTLIEVMIAVGLFLFIGYAVVGALESGTRTGETVNRVTRENERFRKAGRYLVEDLQSTADDQIQTTVLPDGNHEITFMVPVNVGGDVVWGALLPTQGWSAAEQGMEGYAVRYTVETVPDGQGGVDRRLVRQVIDTDQNVAWSRVLAEGLPRGDTTPPGFHLETVGAMRRVTLTTLEQGVARTVVWDVAPRN